MSQAQSGADMLRDLNIVVCGSGNGARCAAGLFGCRSDNVSIYLSPKYEDRAETLYMDIKKNSGCITVDLVGTSTSYKGKVARVTTDASIVKDADAIFVVLPAIAHESLFSELSPFLSKQMVVFLPGNSGWNYILLQQCLGEAASGLTFVASKALPWACRISGPASVSLIGVKEFVSIVVAPADTLNCFMTAHLLDQLCPGNTFHCEHNPLEATLLPFNIAGSPILHPGIMYARWVDYEGEELDEKPLFYNAATERTVEALNGIWGDLKACVSALADTLGVPEVPLPTVQEMMLKRYHKEVGDPSTLLTTLLTNQAYANLCHPMKQTASTKWVPDFHNRYLAEDIPFGLVAMKGVAELLGVSPTPWFDRVIYWGQKVLGKTYLVDGKLTGPDVSFSGAPQRFGHTSLVDLLVFEPRGLPKSALEALRKEAAEVEIVRVVSRALGDAELGAVLEAAVTHFSDEVEDGEPDLRGPSFSRQEAVKSLTERAKSGMKLSLDPATSAMLAINLQTVLSMAAMESTMGSSALECKRSSAALQGVERARDAAPSKDQAAANGHSSIARALSRLASVQEVPGVV